MTTYKLGKLPARPGAVKMALANYIDKSALPKPPEEFGHHLLVADWMMLGNDNYGDCVWAGAAHETMMWNKEANKVVEIDEANVLADYAKVTGFKPNDPATDNGTDMQLAASYRRKTGVLDKEGKRHKIKAYLAIKAGSLQEHLIAMYLFGAVGIGIKFPKSAMKQFDAGQPWTIVKGSHLDGGHYIPLVAKQGGNLICVTWGKLQPMTIDFFKKYNDESLAYVSEESLINNKSPEGFDAKQLLADLAMLKKA